MILEMPSNHVAVLRIVGRVNAVIWGGAFEESPSNCLCMDEGFTLYNTDVVIFNAQETGSHNKEMFL